MPFFYHLSLKDNITNEKQYSGSCKQTIKKKEEEKTMKKLKRWGSVMLLVTTMLSGCGMQESTADAIERYQLNGEVSQTSASEKYVEQSKKVPYEGDAESFISLEKDVDGNMHFFSKDENFNYHDYEMNPLAGEEMVYEKTDMEWLHQAAPNDEYWVLDVRMDTEKNPVACMGTMSGDWLLVKDAMETKIKDCPGGIAITADNLVVLPYDQTGCVVDFDGKKVYSFDKGRAPSTVSQAADTNDTYIACKTKKEDAVVVYDYVEKQEVAKIPYEFNQDEDVVIRLDQQNNVYIADGRGIHRASMTDESFSTLVVADDTTMGISSTMVEAMEVDNEGKIWCVLTDFNSRETGVYCYTKSDIETLEVLDLYTMQKSDWIKKLVIDFRNAYPQYGVNLMVDDDKNMTEQDKIRNLNAQLLSGSGPDIIMLDGLPVNSYMEKGMLVELSECLENSDVIEGVKNTIQKEAGIYAMPTRMGIPVILDKNGEAGSFDSIESLLTSLMNNDIKLPAIAADSLSEFLTVVYYDELFTSEGMLDEAKLSSLIDVMKTLKRNGFVGEVDTQAREFREKNGLSFGLTYLPTFGWNADLAYNMAMDMANVAVQECSDINIGLFGIAKELQANMSILDHMYFPYGQLGINSGSSKQEAAKQFIAFALSEQEQSAYIEDGIPVTNTGLDAWTKVTNSTFAMGFEMPDGRELEIGWPTESEIRQFVDLCKTVDKSQQMEKAIFQMINTQCQNYLSGDASENEIQENIKSQVHTYLEEQK